MSRQEIWDAEGLRYSNVRWSWSAVNHETRTVSFTVWTDLINPNSKTIEHLVFMDLEDENSNGYNEAKRNTEYLTQGYRLLVLFADSTHRGWGTLPERKIKRHNKSLRECDWRYDQEQKTFWCRPTKLEKT
jgi:hypothetical protein